MSWLAILLLLFVAYCVTSWFFLRRPLLIHRKVEPLHFSRPFLHIAHRGGGGEFPENTLVAFQNGARHADVLELDVRCTKDDVIVISHDPDMGRVSKDARPIRELNFDELPLVEGKEPVCTLEALLDDEICKNAPICLDFKWSNDDMIERVYRMFEERNRLNLLVWGSFSEATRKKLVKRYPHVPTFCSLAQTAFLYLFFLLGLLPFVPIDSTLMATVLIREEWLELFLRRKHSFPLNVFLKILALGGPQMFSRLIEHPTFVMHLHRRGMRVVFWTCNDEADFGRVRRSGASGYVTDFPSKGLHK